jgi:hypothetical protein
MMRKAGGWCGLCGGAAGRVVTWRRAQMVLLSAQGKDVAAIARVAFTSEDRVRDMIPALIAARSGWLHGLAA